MAEQHAPGAAGSDEPGSVSSPEDVDGQGPVTLADRMRPGGQGSPDTNQAAAEPMPASAGDPVPTAALPAPSLDDMNVGGADPQSPDLDLARPSDLPSAGPATPVPSPQQPAPHDGGGQAQRAPGSLGRSPQAEQQETDVAAGAAAMGPTAPVVAQPGDAQDVPVPHDLAAPGTSEQLPVVQGVRPPEHTRD